MLDRRLTLTIEIPVSSDVFTVEIQLGGPRDRGKKQNNVCPVVFASGTRQL